MELFVQELISQLEFNRIQCDDLKKELKEESQNSTQYFWKAVEEAAILLQNARS